MPKTTKQVKTDKSINDKKKEVYETSNTKAKVVSLMNNTVSKKTSVTTKKNSNKEKSSTKRISTASTKNSNSSKTKHPIKKDSSTSLAISTNIVEYYDLPYRYNQTLVKILAQTPSTLFIYWDISDIDRKNFIEKYGNDFFNRTKPVLIVHNKTKNLYFEVEINDFANSWYLHMQEPNCEYDIELGRRDIKNFSQYVYVSSSNNLVSPNDHVLFEETDFTNIQFKNVKTGSISQKNFGSIHLMTNVGNIYNKKHKIYHFYNNVYKDEVLDNYKMLSNPSSSNLLPN